MKKLSILFLSLLMAYLSYGQTNGTGASCNDAILFQHTEGGVKTANYSSLNDYWFTFTATGDIIDLSAFEVYNQADIYLYDGTCSQLNQLAYNKGESLFYNSLTSGNTYYVHIDGKTFGDDLTINVSKTPQDTSEIQQNCIPISECNRLANGDFNDYTLGSATQGHFNEYYVHGWSALRGTPDLGGINADGLANLWAMVTSGDNKDHGESIITCTELNTNSIYLLSFEYRIIDYYQTGMTIDLYANIGTALPLDTLQHYDMEYSNYTNISENVTYIPNLTTTNGYIQYTELFSPQAYADRFFMYGRTTSINLPISFHLDSITITPIEYEDVTTCLESIQIFPECSLELSQLNGVQYSWSPSNVIISGGNTLTPVVNTTSSPELTLTVQHNGETETLTVNVTYDPINLEMQSTQVSCFGGNDGSATALPSDGTLPYSYEWNNLATTQTINNLGIGTYQVTVTDSIGCIATDEVIISQPDQIISSTEVQHTCDSLNNGSIDLTVSGGVQPYLYDWDNNGTGGNDPQDLASLAAGTYTVTITDANGCTHIESATIDASQLIVPTATLTHITCNGDNDGAIDLSVANGVQPYQYDWDNDGIGDNDDTQDLTGLSQDIYNVTITDANDCISTFSATINEPNVLSSSLTTTDNNCYGDANGEINLTVTGGTQPYQYDWDIDGIGDNDDSEDLTGLAVGTYSVTITDENGCITNNQATISQPTEITSTFTVLHACDGETNGSIDLTVTGGVQPYTFAWSNSSSTEDIGGLGAGTYTATVTDANGCEYITQSITVNQSSSIELSINATDITCFELTDGSIDLIVSGGNAPYQFDWDIDGVGDFDDTQNLTALAQGTYSVTVQDANNCTATGSANIVEPAELEVILDNLVHATCNNATDGSIEVTVIGGIQPYTYEWDGPNNFSSSNDDIFNLGYGTYSLVVTDANGCTARPKYDIDTVGLAAVLITDAPQFNNSCCAIASLNPTNGTAPYTWAWSGNNYTGSTQDIDELCNGDYSYTLTDANGCELTDVFNIQSLPCPSYVPAELWLCGSAATQTLTAIVANPLWNTGETTQSIVVDEPGLYSYTYEDVDGCESCPNSFIVRGEDDFTLEYEYDCNDGKNILVVAPTGFITYTWNVDLVNSSGQIVGNYTDYINYNNSISIPILDINDFNLSGIEMHASVQANNGTCLLGNTVIIPKVLPLSGNDQYTYVIIEDDKRFEYIFDLQNGWSSYPTPIGANDFNNSIILAQTEVIIKQPLTIENSTILCDVDAKFEIPEGYYYGNPAVQSAVTFNNSKLKQNGCFDKWDGILVKGNPSAAHNQTVQPSVVLYNTTIQDAVTAVQSSDGGVVRASVSKFINNGSGIKFDAYNGDSNCNASQITNNEFEHDHYATIALVDFINLYRIPSMKIYSNDFSNNNYSLGIHDRGTAVFTNRVVNLEVDYTNTFDRMTNAIKIYSSINTKFERNMFTNNYQGALISSVKVLSAKKNQFNDVGLLATEDAFQMSVAGCTSPDISFNTFKNGVTGLHLAKSNYEDFQIFKNNFENFNVGSGGLSGYPTAFLNEAINGTFPPFGSSVGAELKCNNFTNYDYAIAIMNGAVKRDHGYDGGTDHLAPAGNQFYDDGNMSDGRFFVSTVANQSLYKYFRHNQDFTNPELAYTGASNIDVENTQTNFLDNPTFGSCPEESTVGGGFSTLQSNVSDTNTEIESKEESLETKVDNGNTELLLSDIAMTTDATYTELVQEIQSIDSYLSDEAAIEFMEKPTDRPVAKTIALVANSPLPEVAKDKIADLDVSDELKNYILAQQNGLSKREQEEKEIHLLKLRKDELLRRAVRMAYEDETNSIYPAVVNLLQEQGDWKQKTLAYKMLIHAKLNNEAASLLSQLGQDIAQFENDMQYQLEDYLNLICLETEIDSLEDSLRVVKIIEQQELLNSIMIDESSEGAVIAEHLLVEAGLYQDVLDLHLPNPNQANRNAIQYYEPSKTHTFTNTQDILEVYPNPVDDKLTVEYIMFNGLTSKHISIYDINGKLLISQNINKTMDIIDINVSQLSAGTYIIAFGETTNSSNSKKFIVK